MKLSIGEVSKIFNISKETLRYYDKIGILKPEVNEVNGYRFYEFKHLEKLDLILGIKLLGISLSDIKETIESENLTQYKNLVSKQEEVLQIKKKELESLEYNLNKSRQVLDKVINFKNEYNFESLRNIQQNEKLYSLNTTQILNSNTSSYNNSLYEEVDNRCFYIF
ncbi:MAG: MerR family transcriptional regulator, partial [Peptostreptococcaceae bacterium]